MLKYVTIVLFLHCMNSPAFTQNYTLTADGFEHIKIGDSLDTSMVQFVKPVSNHSDFAKLDFSFTDTFNYYYVTSVADVITIDTSIVVKDIFIGTTKENVIRGFIVFIDKKFLTPVTDVLNKVFDGPKLGSVSSVGNEPPQRVKLLWAKNGILAFVTVSYSDLIKLEINRSERDGDYKPWMSRRE